MSALTRTRELLAKTHDGYNVCVELSHTMFIYTDDTNSQLDMSVTQKLARGLRVYVNALNLNDSLLRYYQGVPDRVQQEEHYHWWSEFGVKVEF